MRLPADHRPGRGQLKKKKKKETSMKNSQSQGLRECRSSCSAAEKSGLPRKSFLVDQRKRTLPSPTHEIKRQGTIRRGKGAEREKMTEG